jgi:hypothetical protein
MPIHLNKEVLDIFQGWFKKGEGRWEGKGKKVKNPQWEKERNYKRDLKNPTGHFSEGP